MKAKRILVAILCIILLTSCGKTEEPTTQATTEETTGITTEVATATEAEAATEETSTEEETTEAKKEPSTTEYGDKVEYIESDYGTIERYTIKRDGMDQV